jgi:long-chain fatty acid transport protein
MKRSLHQASSSKIQTAILLALGLTLLAANRSPAIGFLIPNQDAEAIARGNAFAATADNPSAIFYNPAGISQLPGQQLEVGVLNYLGLNVGYQSSANNRLADTKFQVIPVPQIFYTVSPTNLPLSFGLGVYAPFGLGVEWPANSGLRTLALNSKLTFLTINPVVSWKISDSLALALGPTINYAKIKFSRGLQNASDYFEFIGDDFAYGLNAGLLWQPDPKWSFGANYRLATTLDFNGTSTYTPAAGPTASAGTTAGVPFPQIVSGGISYRPTPKWNFEADLDWIDWSPLGTVTLAGTKNIFGFNLPLQLNWHDSWQYKFGVTRYFAHGWFASAGYFFTSDTASSQYFTPAIPDTNLHVGSLGFGHRGRDWHWALAGQIIAGEPRKITASAGNSNPFTGATSAGSYQLFIPTVTLSVSYNF